MSKSERVSTPRRSGRWQNTLSRARTCCTKAAVCSQGGDAPARRGWGRSLWPFLISLLSGVLLLALRGTGTGSRARGLDLRLLRGPGATERLLRQALCFLGAWPPRPAARLLVPAGPPGAPRAWKLRDPGRARTLLAGPRDRLGCSGGLQIQRGRWRPSQAVGGAVPAPRARLRLESAVPLGERVGSFSRHPPAHLFTPSVATSDWEVPIHSFVCVLRGWTTAPGRRVQESGGEMGVGRSPPPQRPPALFLPLTPLARRPPEEGAHPRHRDEATEQEAEGTGQACPPGDRAEAAVDREAATRPGLGGPSKQFQVLS